MRAIQIDATGGPEVLKLVEIPAPVAGPGQILIRNQAIGLNFRQYSATPHQPGRYSRGRAKGPHSATNLLIKVQNKPKKTIRRASSTEYFANATSANLLAIRLKRARKFCGFTSDRT